MKKKALSATVFVAVFLFLGTGVWAQANGQFKAALMDFQGNESLRQLILAIAQETGAKVDIQIVPSARALVLVQNKAIDIECPQLISHSPQSPWLQTLDYSTDAILSMDFVLYTNKAKPLDIASLKAGNPKGYYVETDLSNLASFEFKASPTTNFGASLKKVDSGVIDGFIYAQAGADPILKGMGLKNVNRQLYDSFQLVFALQKGARGGPADRMLSAGLKKMRANGSFQILMARDIAAGKYDDWQP